jgi:simple sugar transport system permease protein
MEVLRKKLKNSDKNIITLFCIAIAIVIIMTCINTDFLEISNIKSMSFQLPEFGILCFGMMLCMISGGIDLSLVGTANLSGIVTAVIIIAMNGSPTGIVIGIVAGILTGVLCGLFNGFLIGQLQIPAMLVTLCGGQLYTGLGMVITKGPAITGLPDYFQNIANGTIGGIIPISLMIFIAFAIGINFIFKYTILGKQICFMGSNSTASRYSGINNLRVTLLTYMISGISAAISGIIIISHYGSAKSDYGSSYVLLTLLIVVFAGVDPAGGKGRVLAVGLTVLILQLISSACNILRFDSFTKTVIWGLMLILIMTSKYLINEYNQKIRGKAK